MKLPENVKEDFKRETERLVISEEFGDCVAVNHAHLDSLIGSLLHLCDLIGGQQGEALKSEIKNRSRAWLNDQYHIAGYKDAVR